VLIPSSCTTSSSWSLRPHDLVHTPAHNNINIPMFLDNQMFRGVIEKKYGRNLDI
jgi:hypothetical protein